MGFIFGISDYALKSARLRLPLLLAAVSGRPFVCIAGGSLFSS